MQETDSEENQNMTATLPNGEIASYRAPVSSHLLEITEHLHVVSILVTLSNCQSMTELIIQQVLWHMIRTTNLMATLPA